MKSVHVRYDAGFKVRIGDEHSQAATLVIEPGKKVGGAHNRHAGADQWIYVERGMGEADIAGKSLHLGPGTLILIQRGEAHGFRATGDTPLCILTFYVPPAYDENENELPAGRP